MSSDKMATVGPLEGPNNHENHEEKELKLTKRASDSRESVSKPKRKRTQSTSEKLAVRTHVGKKLKEKHKGKHSRRPRNEIGMFRFRHGGSISDPLNLQGKDGLSSECSTCAPSPADTPPMQASPKPEYFNDPLNLKKADKKEKHKSRSKKKRSQSASDVRSHSTDDVATVSKVDVITDQQQPQEKLEVKREAKKQKDHARFCYGNYNRYYGYRYGGVMARDARIDLFHKELFEGKDVLDIGCNTGQVTIAIAQNYHPKCITGIDIDGSLIRTARKNVLRVLPSPTLDGKAVRFPLAIIMTYGPLASLPSKDSSQGNFPENIKFEQENYVPSGDTHLEGVEPSFDVILALSLTKWIHLNWGDAGIKRSFRKMYEQLKPGGALILEMQEWDTYKRRKNLTPTINANYKSIEFKPHQFSEYLLSEEVGFTEHHILGVPKGTSKGFERPLELFVKGAKDPGTEGTEQPVATGPIVDCKGEEPGSTGLKLKSNSNSESESESVTNT